MLPIGDILKKDLLSSHHLQNDSLRNLPHIYMLYIKFYGYILPHNNIVPKTKEYMKAPITDNIPFYLCVNTIYKVNNIFLPINNPCKIFFLPMFLINNSIYFNILSFFRLHIRLH